MPNVDLSTLTIEELEILRNDIDAEKMRRREEERERLSAEVHAAAARYSMSVNQFLKAGAKKRRVAAAPKFRNPDNPKEIWSGRGKKPAWVQKALADGIELTSLECTTQSSAEA
jgi:DNA-binding protein H-NS